MSGTEDPAAVRVLRGRADADELAAVLAVLHALAARTAPAAPDPAPARPRATWRRPRHRPHTGTWRTPPMSLR
ncbi:acyl-CoA carboxylase epsilon subunit [Streptomyces sp. NPDC004561]